MSDKKYISKIHGKYYDLKSFNHPGGSTALWHSYGRDSTVLFESHHPLVSKDKLEIILKKYEIPVPENFLIKDEQQFTFDSDFAVELKREVKIYFNEISKQLNVPLLNATKANRSRLIINMILCFLQFWMLFLFCQGNIWAYFLEPIVSWIALSNSFHDACHFAFSINPRINSIVGHVTGLSLSQPLDWYHQHNIGHHAYTNIAKKDPDLYHGSSMLRVHESVRLTKKHQKQANNVLYIWLTAVQFGLIIIKPIQSILSGFYNRCVPIIHATPRQRLIHLLEKIIYIWIYIVTPYQNYDFLSALVLVNVSRMIFSFCFMINSQITHIHTECMTVETDWYKHQVVTSSNHSLQNSLAFLISGGLNYQIEHHLFPNINHCHYPEIQKIVEKICNKHQIPYKKFDNFYDAIKDYCQHIDRMSQDHKKNDDIVKTNEMSQLQNDITKIIQSQILSIS